MSKPTNEEIEFLIGLQRMKTLMETTRLLDENRLIYNSLASTLFMAEQRIGASAAKLRDEADENRQVVKVCEIATYTEPNPKLDGFDDQYEGPTLPLIVDHHPLHKGGVRIAFGEAPDSKYLFIERGRDGQVRVFVHPHDGDATVMLEISDAETFVERQDNSQKWYIDNRDHTSPTKPQQSA